MGEKIVQKLRSTAYQDLRRHPHFGPHVRKLKGYQPETWRYRIGAWRFFYEIDDEEGFAASLIDRAGECWSNRGPLRA